MSYSITEEKRQAFAISLSGEGEQAIQWAITNKALNLGWKRAKGLTNPDLCYEDFREIIHREYFPNDDNYRRSGRLASDAWRFIREMEVGNYVVISTDTDIYVGKVVGDAYFDDAFVEKNKGYKRKIEWLNDANPIPPGNVPPKLEQKLSSSYKVTDISGLMQEVEFSIRTRTTTM